MRLYIRWAQAKKMKYYTGAYYLIRLRKSNFGTYEGVELHTCSTCINDSYFDSWSISWAESGRNVSDEVKSDLSLDEKLIQKYIIGLTKNWLITELDGFVLSPI